MIFIFHNVYLGILDFILNEKENLKYILWLSLTIMITNRYYLFDLHHLID